ncbi:MAG TPA: hypothetical protein VGH02_09330 [Rhizomicrobium sp.]
MDTLPRIKAVSAGKAPFLLNIAWNDGTNAKVDLTGLVHSSRHFKIFASDRKAFVRVKPDEFGTGIEWENGLDYSAGSLRKLSEEQKPVGGKSLVQFEQRHNLNTEETACIFSVTDRTVQSYRKMEVLPKAVAVAMRHLDEDPTAFAAHYKPIAMKPRGRPKANRVG